MKRMLLPLLILLASVSNLSAQVTGGDGPQMEVREIAQLVDEARPEIGDEKAGQLLVWLDCLDQLLNHDVDALALEAAIFALREDLRRISLECFELEPEDQPGIIGQIDQRILDLQVMLFVAPAGPVVPLPPRQPPPPPPPPPPPAACSTRILARVGGTLADPGGRFFLTPGKALRLEAEGDPAGGTFEWEVIPGLIQGTGIATRENRLSFLATGGGFSRRIKVTYTDPFGNMCEDQIEVVVRCF